MARWWQCLREEQGGIDEHYARFYQLTPDNIIAELAWCHSSASALLKHKWLTVPEHILANVSDEYDESTREPQHFRTESDADCRLRELSVAILEPLIHVPAMQPEQADEFVLRLFADEERLADITGTGEGWTWRLCPEDTLTRLVLKGITSRPEYFRQRLHDIIVDPGIMRNNIAAWIHHQPADAQKMVRNILAE